ncbi:mitochondrial inner membrane protease subunit 1-like [Convolutriloba macropyga]|uniref:mitochondrial inner membrane protease subunit 1-like n=1 Tax=Convolutriloba macropyga TaxID=536237 RepID=UPI003F522E10
MRSRHFIFLGLAVGTVSNYYDVRCIEGQSMKPHFNDGDLVLCKKYDLFPVQQDDIVIFRHPNDRRFAIKLAKGFENDILSDRFGETISVPKGHFWAQSSNKGLFKDSSFYGPIPLGLIVGKPICALRFSPFKLEKLG